MAKIEKKVNDKQLKHESLVDKPEPNHIGKVIEENLLQYSDLVIEGRAIPSALDGLKPVNRRILYTFKDSGYLNKFVKAAKVVGSIIGTWHPHGDQAVYGALVDMTQPFKNRFPFTEGQGNWGNIEGDSEAAMRYCVVGDTLINTSKGIFKIKDLVECDINSEVPLEIEILSADNVINKTSKFFNSGKHDIYSLKTIHGYSIKGSINHPLMTFGLDENGMPSFSWKLLRDIAIDDILLIDNTNKKELYSNIETKELDKEKAIIQGVSFFSENISTNENVCPDFILQHNLEIKQHFLNQLFNTKDWLTEVEVPYRTTNKEFIHQLQILLLDFNVLSLIMNIDDEDEELSYWKLVTLKQDFDDNYFYTKVSSIEKLDEQEIVYSIKVESDCHSFTANGFLNHNTEVKIDNNYANLLFNNIEKENVVSFQPNFDDTTQEPRVLPVSYPVALLNGTSGIAYGGITTRIPSYNIVELTKLYIYMIENKFWTKEFHVEKHKKKIMEIIPGVDFPTGSNIYFEGDTKQEDMIFKPEFTVRMRASYEIDHKTNSITFFNIPAEINATRIKEQAALAGLSFVEKNGKQIPKKDPTEILNIIENIDIETYSMIGDNLYKNDAKLTFTFKKGSKLDLELIKAFKYTELDTSYTAKMMFIDRHSCPKLMSLYDHSVQFLMFRLHTFYQAFLYDIKKLKEHIHLLEGLEIIYNALDEFIEIVKNSDDNLINDQLKARFPLDDIQIEYLLSIQLRRLSKTSVEKLKSDIQEKREKVIELEHKISSKDILFEEVKNDYKSLLTNNIIKGKRNHRFTHIIEATKNINKEDMIEDKEVIIMYMEDDTIAFVDKSKFRIKKRGTRTTNNKINSDFELKLKMTETCYIKDDLLLMTNKGRVFKIKAYNFNEDFRFIGNIINIEKDEYIISLLKENTTTEYYSISTKYGKIKGLKRELFSNITSNRAITAINLEDGDEVIGFEPYTAKENEYVLVLSSLGKLLKYKSEEICILAGGNTKGVRSINLNEKLKEEVIKTIYYQENKGEEPAIIGVSDSAKGKKVLLKKIPCKKRAGASVQFFNNCPQNGTLIGAAVFVNQEEEILMLLNEIADVSFIKILNFKAISRTSKGAVKLLNLMDGEKIKACKKTYLVDLSDTQSEIILDEFENESLNDENEESVD